ncbi:MAG: hypothetical protein IIA85_00535 [Nanoarchaeota archaeon]|nr:hypothetical protein [Nanoarchaeota archaeon]
MDLKETLEEVELRVKRKLEKDSDITVELSNLQERTYYRLEAKLKENYEVRGIVNILRIRKSEYIGKEDYTLHISKRYENA